MSKKQNIQVVKINTDRPSFRPKNFPRMPILYLELLENKAKIDPKLVNQEYVPKNLPNLPVIQEENDIKNNDVENYSPSPAKSSPSPSPSQSLPSPSSSPSPSSLPSPSSSPSKSSPSSTTSSKSNSRKSSPASSVKSSNISPSKNDDDDLSSRMKELLTSERKNKDRDLDRNNRNDRDRNDRDDRKDRHKKQRDDEIDDMHIPPKLSDIAGGNFVPKKVIEELREDKPDEEDLKRELLFKFQLMKRSYKNNPNVNSLPEFTIHSDYKTMVNSYDMAVRQLSVDNNIENYKTYLITAFYIIEFILGYWLKFDMQDFTKQQIISMNKYEHLLIELGEKTYVPEGSKWSVEVRLLFTIVIQTAIFIITKMVMKKVGGNLFGMLDGLINNANVNSNNPKPQEEQPARRMRGPNINNII
jgi:hypothetical protein